MAQEIAQRAVKVRGWDRVEIRSAGVSAYPGVLASEEARSAAAKAGLSLEEHRSSLLKAELVTWADLILTMGTHHLEVVARLGGKSKASMLTAFATKSEEDQEPEVPDPFGGDAQTYIESFRTIADLVETTLERVGREWGDPNEGADS